MIAYILKSSLSLIILFGLYWFLLRREKLFIFNRYFLIFSILFSLVITFISIPVNIRTNETQKNIITLLNGNLPALSYEQNPITNSSKQQYTVADSFTEASPAKISFSQILIIVYVIGLILLLFRFTKNIFTISRQIQLSESINFSGKKLVLIDHQVNPYCFFNTIFVYKHDYLNNKIAKEFLAHELEHIRQSHSIDIIFIELIRIVYWFNPILFLYSRAIRVNHEYLADSGVLRDSLDIKNYADKLLSLISYRGTISLTSGFNHSLMKRRLLMITKSKPKSTILSIRIIVTLSLVLIITFLISLKESKSQPMTSLTNHNNAIDTLLIDEDSIRGNRPWVNIIRQSFNVTDKNVSYTASGYINRDTINKVVVLRCNAIVNFGETTIKADSIVFNMITNQLFASGRLGDSGKIIGKPIFKVGSQEFEADELTYNFNTRKALIKNIKTQENEVFKDSSTIVKPNDYQQYDKLYNDGSDPIEKSVTLQDNISNEWWLPIVKKHGINYESYTIRNEFVIFGKKTTNGDIESFNDVIAISSDKDNYCIYRSKTASYEIKSKWLKINDCSMEWYYWDPSYTSTLEPFYHKNVSINLDKGWMITSDTLSNTDEWWQPIIQKHKIDLEKFAYKNTFVFGSGNMTEEAFALGKNPRGKDPIITLDESILILKSKSGYNLITAKSAKQDSENNQMTYKNGVMETFADGDEWMESPEFENYIILGKKLSFDEMVLNIKTRKILVKNNSGTLTFN